MCIEIEAKLKVESFDQIKERLENLAAEFLDEKLQTDYYFDDANGDLAKTDKCLRLRREVGRSGEKIFLTYKGAKDKAAFKKRSEINLEVADSQAATKLLTSLGYEKALVFEKKRQTWRLGDCEVALDQLPLLGAFVEIEGPDENKIADVQRKLGLADLPHVKNSYADLMVDKLTELGHEQKEVLF